MVRATDTWCLLTKAKNLLRQSALLGQRKRRQCFQVGFVGKGSVDWHEDEAVELGPGETWSFVLVAHAPSARQDTYTLKLQAFLKGQLSQEPVATGELILKVKPATLKLRHRIEPLSTPQDRARLASTLTLINDGTSVPDLTIEPGEGLINQVRIAPDIRQKILYGNEKIAVLCADDGGLFQRETKTNRLRLGFFLAKTHPL